MKGTQKVSDLLINNKLSQKEMNEIETILPIGWAHGDRYSQKQWIGPEKYC